MKAAAARGRSALSFLLFLLGLTYAVVEGSYQWRGRLDVQLFGWLLFGLGGLGWLAWRAFSGRARLPHSGLGWVFALGLLSVALSLLFSPDPRQSLWRVTWLAGYVLLFYLLLDGFASGLLEGGAFLSALLWVSGAAVLLALLETYAWYLGWIGAVGRELPPFQYRFGSLFGYSNVLMSLANLAAPVALVLFLTARSRPARVGAALWLVMFLLAIPFSSSRGGWIGIAGWLGCLALLWLWERQPWRVLARLAPGLRAGLAAGGLLALAALGALGLRFWLAFSSHPSHGGDPFGGRIGLWAPAIQLWQSSPLVGIGPGRFALADPGVNPNFPPSFWSYNAHGLPVEVLTEFGLLGAAVFLALLAVAAAGLWRRYRSLPPEQRALPRAALAALSGWLCQMVVDDFTSWIAIMVPLIALAAWMWAKDPLYPPAPSSRREGRGVGGMGRNTRSLAWLLVPAGMLMGYAGWDLWAYQPAWEAIRDAQIGEWSAAARGFETSRARDPLLQFYTTEAAWAHAAAWGESGDPAELEAARRLLADSVAREGQFSQFWASLAALDWQAGDSASALARIAKAAALSPREASYPLNQGYYQERLSQEEAAIASYRKALELAPGWATHPFWQSSPLRRRALQGLRLPAEEPAPRVQEAQTAMKKNQLDQAARALAFAALEGEPSTAVDVGWARLTGLRGDQAGMVRQLERLRDSLVQPILKTQSNLSFGYTLWAYNRPGPLVDLVPGYLRLDGDFGQFSALEELRALEARAGQCAQAAQTWQALQAAQRGFAPESLPPAPDCP